MWNKNFMLVPRSWDRTETMGFIKSLSDWLTLTAVNSMTEESSSLAQIVLSPNSLVASGPSADVAAVAPANFEHTSEWDLGAEKNPFLEMSQDQIQKLDEVLSSEQARQILSESSRQFSSLQREPVKAVLEDSLGYIMSGSSLAMLEPKTEEILQVFATSDSGGLPPASQEFILTADNVEISTEILDPWLQDHDYDKAHIGHCIIMDHPYSLVPPTVAPPPVTQITTVTSTTVNTSATETEEEEEYGDPSSPRTPGNGKGSRADVSSPVRRSQRQIEKHEREQLEKIKAENAEMARRERAEMLRKRRSEMGMGPTNEEENEASPLDTEDETEKRIASICGEIYEGPESAAVQSETSSDEKNLTDVQPKTSGLEEEERVAVNIDNDERPSCNDADMAERAKQIGASVADCSEKADKALTVEKLQNSADKSKAKPEVTRKMYPKRENRKPPQHLMDMFEPPLFSKPDQLKKVDAKPGEHADPRRSEPEAVSNEKVPAEEEEDTGELMIVVAVDDPSGGDSSGANLIQITGSAVDQEEDEKDEETAGPVVAAEKVEQTKNVVRKAGQSVIQREKLAKKNRIVGKKIGKLVTKVHKVSAKGQRVPRPKKKHRGHGSEGPAHSGSDSDDAFDDDNEDSDWHSEDDPDRLWCICKQPHNDRFMISCDLCGDWFHGTCVGVTKKQGRELERSGREWHCSKCRKGKSMTDTAVVVVDTQVPPRPEKKKHDDKAMKAELSKFIRTKPPGKIQERPVKRNPATPDERKPIKQQLSEAKAAKVSEPKGNPRPTDPRQPVSIIRLADLKPVSPAAKPAEQKIQNSLPPRQVEAKPVSAHQPLSSDPRIAANCAPAKPADPKPVTAKPDTVGKPMPKTPTVERKILPKIPKLSSSGSAVPAANPPTTNNSQGSKCVGCGRPARVDSVYCSSDCIKQHAAESLHVLNKEKKTMVKKSEPINLKESAVGVKLVVDRKTGKPVVGVNAPSDGNLQAWLRDHPMYAIIRQRELLSAKKQNQQQAPAVHPPPAAVVPEEKKEEKKVAAPEVKPTSHGPEPIRLNVRKTLKDILASRSKDAGDVMASMDEIRAISLKIEEELFRYFGDIGNKYKAKYRSLMFNIKDNRNHGLFRKILKGRITPYKLVRMTPEELASRELAEWRERENKHAIEMIKRDQELQQQQQATHIIKKTHKGEVEIDEVPTKFIETVQPEDVLPEKPEKPTKPKADTIPPSVEALLGTMLVDTTEGHRSHLFDLNCKICTGKMAPPAEEPPAKKARVLKTVLVEEKSDTKVRIELPQKEEEEEEEEEVEENEAAVEVKEEEVVKVKPLKPARKDADRSVPKAPKSVKIEVDKERDPTSTVIIRSPDSAVPTQSDADVKGKNSTPTVWKGFITMQEVAKFVTIAQKVSGHTDFLSSELPDTIHVCGRINPITVWDYITKQKNSQTKDLLIIRFQPANDEEKASYLSFYTYLSTRNRFGVVATASKIIKDFYIVPLASNATIPSSLKPFDGPGLGEPRTNTLLGLILRHKVKKRTADADTGHRPPLKVAKKRTQLNESSTSKDASYTPPLDSSGKLTKKVRIVTADDEPYEPSSTPPLEKKSLRKRKVTIGYDGGFTPPLDKLPRAGGGDSPYSPKDESPGDDEPYDPEEADKESKEVAPANLIPSLLKGAVTAQNVSELIDQISMSANPTEMTTSVLASIATATNLEQQRKLLIELTQKVEEQKRQLEMQKKQIVSSVTATIIGAMPLPIVSTDTMMGMPMITPGFDMPMSTPQPVPPPQPLKLIQDAGEAYTPSNTPPMQLPSRTLLPPVEPAVTTSVPPVMQSLPTFVLGDTSNITLPPNLQDILERIKNPIPATIPEVTPTAVPEPEPQPVKAVSGGILEDPIVKRFSTKLDEEDEEESPAKEESTPPTAEETPKPAVTMNTDPRLKGKTVQTDPRVRTQPAVNPQVSQSAAKLEEAKLLEQRRKSELGSMSATELLEKAMMQFQDGKKAPEPVALPVIPPAIQPVIPPALIPIPPSPPPPPPPPPQPAAPKISLKFAPKKVLPTAVRSLDTQKAFDCEPPPPGTEPTPFGKPGTAGPLFPSAAYTAVPGAPRLAAYPGTVSYPNMAEYQGQVGADSSGSKDDKQWRRGESARQDSRVDRKDRDSDSDRRNRDRDRKERDRTWSRHRD